MKCRPFVNCPAFVRLVPHRRERALSRAAGLLVALCALLCSEASAQYYVFDGRVIGSIGAEGLHLHVQFDWTGAYQWTQTPAGIDVYRRAVGLACGSWELITDEPVAWSWQEESPAEPHLSFDVVDSTAEPNHGYMYQARAVDSQRHAIPENPDAYLGVATHGIALLGHGTLQGGPGGCGESYVQYLDSCSQECFPPLRFDAASEVTPHVNSGTAVLVYGVVSDVIPFCQANETVAYFYSAVPSPCVVPVEEKTWGAVKSRYR